MPVRTHVILDGLQDPRRAAELSARWALAGFDNTVDVAGQCASLAPRGVDAAPSASSASQPDAALSEADIDRAASIARSFGIELRERAGQTFVAGNDLETLRRQTALEYRARLAQGVMFGLPAVLLHYLGPRLASAGPEDPRTMIYPWLIELALVGWMLFVAGWPILWQGAAAAIHLRMTGDLYASLIVLAAFAPSAMGVVSMLFTPSPWFGPPGPSGVSGPTFHIAAMAIFLFVAQRAALHRHAHRLSGRARWMIPGFGRALTLWLLVCVLAGTLGGWRLGLALALIFPAHASLAAINPWSPGPASLLPALACAGLLLASAAGSPAASNLPNPGPLKLEAALGFQLILTLAMALGWRNTPKLPDAPGNEG